MSTTSINVGTWRRFAPPVWRNLMTAHEIRADALLMPRRNRIERGEVDEVEDFLFTYYPTRPGKLRQWHPGAGTRLRGSADQVRPWVGTRWYRCEPTGVADEFDVFVDIEAFITDRRDAIHWIDRVLRATESRTGYFGCFGMHEWAMVYRQREHRHSLPLRLGQDETDAVVEGAQIRCSHFDAFRFFTPEATSRNLLQPTAESRAAMEQPACLHANMDLLRHALKLIPAVPSALVLDTFELARDIRTLDMEASPYDVTSRGYGTVAVETVAGRAAYVARQREFAETAAALRDRILEVTALLVTHEPSM